MTSFMPSRLLQPDISRQGDATFSLRRLTRRYWHRQVRWHRRVAIYFLQRIILHDARALAGGDYHQAAKSGSKSSVARFRRAPRRR